MNIFLIGVLIIFGLFVVILITNPRLSCFGKKIKSPFYPLFRRKRKKGSDDREKKIDDYGFSLVKEEERIRPRVTHLESRKNQSAKKNVKVNDYGFSLSDKKKESAQANQNHNK
ncbi:MAG: hypothetical protein GF421_02635 [Candidatus Aminicenantes bacterium]|nr:hypothetical protein [Candidatus Aminicenantes bacterium]